MIFRQIVPSGKHKLLTVALAAAIGVAAAVSGAPQAAQAKANAYPILSQRFIIDSAGSTLPVLNTDNTTYVALRILNERLGLKTKWDAKQNTVTVSGRDRVLVLELKTGAATLNGQKIYGLPAIVQSNTTYLPLRFLLERMGYGVSYRHSEQTIEVVTINENALKINTQRIAKDGDKLSLRVNYPQIAGFANEAVQTKVNDFLKQEAETRADAGHLELLQAVKGLESDSAVPGVSFEGTYTVTYNEQNRLSLYTDYYIYTGGAHGETVRAAYAFDLTTGNLLTLKDAAEGNADYVKVINAEIGKQIHARALELLEPFKTIEADRPFFLKHNGIVVYFGQYEYTPYAAGMPEFEIPFQAFK